MAEVPWGSRRLSLTRPGGSFGEWSMTLSLQGAMRPGVYERAGMHRPSNSTTSIRSRLS